MRQPDHTTPAPIPRLALTAFLGGVMGGAIATAIIAGPLRVWAADPATDLLAQASVSGDTGLEVDGCRLCGEYQAASGAQPARVVVRGSNPGAAPRTHVVTVTVVAGRPSEPMSRIPALPTIHSETAGTLVLPAQADGAVTIVLPPAIPADTDLVVGVGRMAMMIRMPRGAAAAAIMADPTTLFRPTAAAAYHATTFSSAVR